MEQHTSTIRMKTPPPPTTLKKVMVTAGVFIYLLMLGYLVGAGFAQSLKSILH